MYGSGRSVYTMNVSLLTPLLRKLVYMNDEKLMIARRGSYRSKHCCYLAVHYEYASKSLYTGEPLEVWQHVCSFQYEVYGTAYIFMYL